MAEQIRPTLKDFLVIHPGPWAHRVALRVGISMLVPLLVLVAAGRPEWSPYAAFGAFASLYGRNHIHLPRAVMQASAGALLTVSVVVGVLVGSLESRAWVAVGVTAVVALVGSLVAAAQDWHPPGPLFLVFGFGAVVSIPHTLSDVPVAAAITGGSVLFAVFIGNLGGLLRRPRSRPGGLAPPRPADAVRCAVAVLLAGAAATAVGIGHPYWATVAAVAPLSAPGLTSQLVRAGHRIIGTMLGLLISAVLLAPTLGPLGTVFLVAGLGIVTELVVGRHYGLALVFITPMALLMGQLADPRPIGPLLADRGVETVLGASIGGLIVLAEELLRRRALGRAG
jgi:hypothetical protein